MSIYISGLFHGLIFFLSETSLVSVKRHDKSLKQPLGAYSFIADCFACNSKWSSKLTIFLSLGVVWSDSWWTWLNIFCSLGTLMRIWQVAWVTKISGPAWEGSITTCPWWKRVNPSPSLRNSWMLLIQKGRRKTKAQSTAGNRSWGRGANAESKMIHKI